MNSSVRQISILACGLLVLLRVSIGWQFLYEGLWKLRTLKTAQPWSAEGYLKNARGPFRDTFRGMVDDPDGLNKLNYEAVVKSWDDWVTRFQAHHPDLTEVQKQQIDVLLNGPREFTEPLGKLPAGADFKKLKLPSGTYLKYDEKEKRLATNTHLLPKERDELVAMVPLVEDEAKKEENENAKKYHAAVKKLFERTSRLSLKEKLQVSLKEDPERFGILLEMNAESPGKLPRNGDIQVYQRLLERYEKNLKEAKTAFQQEHLAKQWNEIQEKRAALVGPVDALTAELQTTANKLLTVDQFRRGPVPAAPSQLQTVNQRTMWGLTILGACMMAGLFSRVASLGAAVLLLLFYLPMPPWPGVPEAPGPEHSLIVNKNLIECIACLALASMPTGRWVGLDALIRRFVLRQTTE